MVGTVLVPWWGCNQIAHNDKWYKIYLEYILPCVHVSFVACPRPCSILSVCQPAALWLCCYLFPQRSVALCIPPLQAVGRECIWIPPAEVAGGETTMGLHFLKEVPYTSLRNRLEISALQSGGKMQRGCCHLPVLQPQHHDRFGRFIMGMSWPLVTSEAQ